MLVLDLEKFATKEENGKGPEVVERSYGEREIAIRQVGRVFREV